MKVLTKDGKAPKIKKYGPKEKVMVVPPQRPQNLMIREGKETKMIEFSASGTVTQVSVISNGSHMAFPLCSPRSQTSAPNVVETTYQQLLNVDKFVKTSYQPIQYSSNMAVNLTTIGEQEGTTDESVIGINQLADLVRGK